jgi:hypothetical protein
VVYEGQSILIDGYWVCLIVRQRFFICHFIIHLLTTNWRQIYKNFGRIMWFNSDFIHYLINAATLTRTPRSR